MKCLHFRDNEGRGEREDDAYPGEGAEAEGRNRVKVRERVRARMWPGRRVSRAKMICERERGGKMGMEREFNHGIELRQVSLLTLVSRAESEVGCRG